ncbi:MAG: hypothetical protein JWO36_4363 [Myxococcales bacterium]|nr:hypothetical protein [Myxococcales bacterium]
MVDASLSRMHDLIKGLGRGLIAGIAGLAAMRLGLRIIRPIVRDRAPRPIDVFATARSMSLVGVQHHADEAATDAIARIAYEKLLHHEPSPPQKQRLSSLVHLGYGLAVAALYGAITSRRDVDALRSGFLLGAALWLFGDELVVPLLGLTDKPTAYHPTRHLQSLVAHLGYGLATAATTRGLRSLT